MRRCPLNPNLFRHRFQGHFRAQKLQPPNWWRLEGRIHHSILNQPQLNPDWHPGPKPYGAKPSDELE